MVAPSKRATRLGTVEDVSGSAIRIKLDSSTISGLSFIEGQSYRVGQLGGFVKIPLGFVDLYAIISEIGASAVPERLVQENGAGSRWMSVQLVGEGLPQIGFKRGISQYPTIGDIAHLVTEHDLALIYGRPADPRFVEVGHLASVPSIPALIDIEALVNRHSAVVGSTGSGKSTTVAGLLSAVSERSRYPSARIMVVDVHGEYGRALRDRALTFKVTPADAATERPLCIPYWSLTSEELLNIVFGDLGKDRGRVIDEITKLKKETLRVYPREGVTEDSITVDSPIPFSIHKLWFDLHCEIRATHYVKPGANQSQETWALELDDKKQPVQSGDALKCIPPRFRNAKDVKDDPEKVRLSNSTLGIGRELDNLAAKLRDPRFDFLFRPGDYSSALDGKVGADLDQLLADWLCGAEQRPISILDLSGVPPTIQSLLVGALLRTMYEALFWARYMPEGGRERPLLVVLEEAHVYLGKGKRDENAAAAVGRIAKEGRKYGIGMMLVSQRPAEIDETILSQCGTLIAMRLSNSTDRGHVKSASTESLDGLFAMLPVLRTGEAIIVGEAVNLPIRTQMDRPRKGRRPESDDPKVIATVSDTGEASGVGGWNLDRSVEKYDRMMHAWRRQNPKIDAIQAIKKEEGSSMERKPVSSTNIEEIGFDAETGTLEILFRNGYTYQYFDVPLAHYEALMAAESKGAYLNTNIRKSFRYTRL